MRNKLLFIGLFLSLLFFSGCTISYKPLTTNVNNQTTEVILSKNNFIVVKNVKGEAEIPIRGIFKNIPQENLGLISEAREKMLEGIEIEGKPRAIVNEKVEWVFINYPRKTRLTPKSSESKVRVIVSAQVIEFTD